MLISPCDGYLSVYNINSELSFTVKHVEYNIEVLLNDKELAAKYRGGYCMVFRLAPYNYHRYIFIDSGEIMLKRHILGVLHCVRPEIYGSLPVYITNTREYTLIKSDMFGDIIQMEIGALLVGRINNINCSDRVCRYVEKGYFEFGGSTIILLMEKGMIVPNGDIIKRTVCGKETAVAIGQKIGVKDYGNILF